MKKTILTLLILTACIPVMAAAADRYVRGGEAFRVSDPPLETWEAEAAGSGISGVLVKDSAASGGLARFCAAEDADSEFVFYGQYRDLAPGRYAAVFRIRTGKAGTVPEFAAFGLYASANRGEVNYGESRFLIRDTDEEYTLYPVPFEVLEGQKEIEAVVRWYQNCDVWIDKADIYAWTGPFPDKPGSDFPMLEALEPGLYPRGLSYSPPDYPSEDILPVSKTVSRRLCAVDTAGLPFDMKLLLAGLQGLVNRETPRLYLCAKSDAAENRWLDWMKQRGDIDSVTWLTPEEALRKFKDCYNGAVVTDRRIPATVNAATMYASVNGCLICSPRLARRYDLPVRLDMQGMFENNAQPYYWALENLWDRMYHHAASCLHTGVFNTRDYLVQHRIFVFWIPGRIDGATSVSAPKEELAFVNTLLARLPANTPILGYPWAGTDVGIGEHAGVSLFAKYGHFLTGSAGGNNYSVHSGTRRTPLRQKEPRKLTLDYGKRYVAFTMSDGDNLPVISSDNWPRLWGMKERGAVPITWTVSPLSGVMFPDIMDYYYSTATDNDTFGAAVSGVGYTYPADYGERYTDSGRVFGGFLELTERYMRKMDLRVLFPMHVTEKEIGVMAAGLPWLRGLFPDYFRNVSRYGDSLFLTAGGVPVLRSATTWDTSVAGREYAAQHMAKEIRAFACVREGEPAFVHAFLCNWGYNPPVVKRVAELLGEDWVFVSAEEIAALEKEYLQREKLALSVPGEVMLTDRGRAALSFTVRNASEEPAEAVFELEGAESEPLRAVIGPGAKETLEIGFAPREDRAVLKASFDGKTKEYGVLVRAFDLTGFPEGFRGRRYEQAAHFEAGSLPSLTSETYTTEEGVGYRMAVHGESRDGAVIYGPYMPLEPGRYVAVFSLMRLDDKGDGGQVCSADVVPAGSHDKAVEISVDRGMLPVGKQAFVYAPFEWKEAAQFEARVHWKTGSDSLRVDGVTLLRAAE